MTGWVTQVVEADGTPVGDPLETEAGGTHTYGMPAAGQSPHRLTMTIRGDLPDMRGRFLTDRWGHDKTAAHWWVLSPDAPRHLSDAASSRSITATDMTRLLSRISLPREEVMVAGMDVTDWIDHLLTRYLPRHKSRFRATDVDVSVRSELAYAAGSGLLPATTDPLEACGMWPWQPRPGGLILSTPWTPPALRPTAAQFGVEPDTIGFLGGWEDDPGDAQPPPNEVLALVRASGDLPEIVGRWADEGDIYRHGLISVVVPGQVDAADQATADLIAVRYREDQARPRRSLRFTGAFHPILPGEVAAVAWPQWGIAGRFEVVGKTVHRTVAADTEYTLREV